MLHRTQRGAIFGLPFGHAEQFFAGGLGFSGESHFLLTRALDRAKKLGSTMPEHFLLPTLLEKHTSKTDPLHGGSGFDVTKPQSSWAAEWKKLRKAVGIEHLRFHDLRHSYITRAAEAGIPLPVTQAQVGHMSVQMVEHYTHICHAAIHHAARTIEESSSGLMAVLGLRINDRHTGYFGGEANLDLAGPDSEH